MIFRRKFSVPKFCSPPSIQATHTHDCHSEVSIRLFGLWFARPFALASCKSRPNVSMAQSLRSNEELSRLSYGAASLSAADVR